MRVSRSLLRLAAASLLLLSASTAAPAGHGALPRPRVHPSVHRALRAQATVNLVLTMRAGTDRVLERALESGAAGRAARGDQIAALVTRLEASAATSQRSVAALLSHEADASASPFASAESFWISNQVFVEAATAPLLVRLMAEPAVAEIRQEAVFSIEQPAGATVASGSSSVSGSSRSKAAGRGAVETAWGVAAVGAVDVWAKGVTGERVVVATIDTGARGTHEALRNSFLGGHGWFDPVANATKPTDGAGHGTHVTALVAGAKGVGVAPGAKWMACRGCRSADACAEAALLACAQFVLCPTDAAGSSASRDCNKAPHIVSNSWGGAHDAVGSAFSPVIRAWRAAGIVPLFASGNVVPNKCGTVRAPADSADVIGVGATTAADALWAASAMGPGPAGRLKPDVVAPGADVYSAWHTRDDVYAVASGTSMATPHAAGVAALLLSARPNMTFDQVRGVLGASASRARLASASRSCGNTSDAEFPNNVFGYGRVDALAAISALGL